MRAPKFWYAPRTEQPFFLVRFILQFLALLFQVAAAFKRIFTSRSPLNIPVICVGNLTVGGAGKTPTTLLLARFFTDQGKAVAIISRGYKGQLQGPLLINPKCHSAQDVGDEPLLMAQHFKTWISANRYDGAKAAMDSGADLILLDDGLQHWTLAQDFKICVVDSTLGFGNEKTLPAGPLREPLKAGLNRIDALVVIGKSALSIPTEKPILRTQIIPSAKHVSDLQGKKLIAFAGLAHPEKFFTTLKDEGLTISLTLSFPDHHTYTKKDLEDLKKTAEERGAYLVTTEKDWVRLPENFQQGIHRLPISLTPENHQDLAPIFKDFLRRNPTQ